MNPSRAIEEKLVQIGESWETVELTTVETRAEKLNPPKLLCLNAAETKSFFDQELDDMYGMFEWPNFYLWTPNWVLFKEDGIRVGAVPRHPNRLLRPECIGIGSPIA